MRNIEISIIGKPGTGVVDTARRIKELLEEGGEEVLLIDTTDPDFAPCMHTGIGVTIVARHN